MEPAVLLQKMKNEVTILAGHISWAYGGLHNAADLTLGNKATITHLQL
jgi:hypothetical protein